MNQKPKFARLFDVRAAKRPCDAAGRLRRVAATACLSVTSLLREDVEESGRRDLVNKTISAAVLASEKF
jgi:hypothetical protein